MKFNKKLLAIIALILSSCVLSYAQKTDSYFDTKAEINYESLKAGLYNPPEEAQMRTWWFWMNGIAPKNNHKPSGYYEWRCDEV
jgi:hypothetical protein